MFRGTLNATELETNWQRMKAGEPMDGTLHWSEVEMASWLPTVTAAEYAGGYRLRVSFSDSTEKEIDFLGWLEGPVFEPLRNPQYFQRFFIDGGTVAWPNGADIAPETLYKAEPVAVLASSGK